MMDLETELDALGLPVVLTVDRRNPGEGVTLVVHYPNGTFVELISVTIKDALAKAKDAITKGDISG